MPVFHSGSASPLFFSRFHPATDLPAERQMDICIGMSAIDPAIATLLCNTCLSRSGICYSGHPHPQLLECNFAVQSNGNFLETIRVNLWEGQLASLAWAWDHGRVFQTAALFLLGMLIGRKGLF